MRLRIVVLRLNFRHIIFDLDGTLIDSAGDLVASSNHVLETLGLVRLPAETIIGFVGDGVRKLVERCLTEATGDVVPEARIARGLALLVEHYAAHLLDSTRLYDGVAEVLPELRARGALLSVATNKHEAMARTILLGLGVADVFASIMGGDSLPTHKPDPGIVYELARRTGLAVRETVLVGDSLVDVATARASGVHACAVTWGFARPHVLRAAAPDFLMDRPGELLGLAGGPTR